MAPVAVMSPFDIVKSASSWSNPFPPLPAYFSTTISKKASATSNSDHPATFGPAMMLSLVQRDDQQQYPAPEHESVTRDTFARLARTWSRWWHLRLQPSAREPEALGTTRSLIRFLSIFSLAAIQPSPRCGRSSDASAVCVRIVPEARLQCLYC